MFCRSDLNRTNAGFCAHFCTNCPQFRCTKILSIRWRRCWRSIFGRQKFVSERWPAVSRDASWGILSGAETMKKYHRNQKLQGHEHWTILALHHPPPTTHTHFQKRNDGYLESDRTKRAELRWDLVEVSPQSQSTRDFPNGLSTEAVMFQFRFYWPALIEVCFVALFRVNNDRGRSLFSYTRKSVVIKRCRSLIIGSSHCSLALEKPRSLLETQHLFFSFYQGKCRKKSWSLSSPSHYTEPVIIWNRSVFGTGHYLESVIISLLSKICGHYSVRSHLALNGKFLHNSDLTFIGAKEVIFVVLFTETA